MEEVPISPAWVIENAKYVEWEGADLCDEEYPLPLGVLTHRMLGNLYYGLLDSASCHGNHWDLDLLMEAVLSSGALDTSGDQSDIDSARAFKSKEAEEKWLKEALGLNVIDQGNGVRSVSCHASVLTFRLFSYAFAKALKVRPDSRGLIMVSQKKLINLEHELMRALKRTARTNRDKKDNARKEAAAAAKNGHS